MAAKQPNAKLGCGVLALVGAAAPVALIWVLNTLFGRELDLTFKTWLAAALVCAVLFGFIVPNLPKRNDG